MTDNSPHLDKMIKTSMDNYVSVFTTLTPETVDTLIDLLDDQVVFTDPFNHVTGKAGFRRIFDHMFDTCTNPRFTVSDMAIGEKGCYLRWQMTGQLKSWPRTALNLEGMSEIHLNADGKITHHIDHWDSASQLLLALPVIRMVMRPIMRLFRLK